MTEKIWLTPEEAAAHLKISIKTLYEWSRDQGCPFHAYSQRLRRYERGELDAWFTDYCAGREGRPQRLLERPVRRHSKVVALVPPRRAK